MSPDLADWYDAAVRYFANRQLKLDGGVMDVEVPGQLLANLPQNVRAL